MMLCLMLEGNSTTYVNVTLNYVHLNDKKLHI